MKRRALKIAHTITTRLGLEDLWQSIRGLSVSVDQNESVLCYQALNADRKPGIMFDIGAHYGRTLAPFAKSGWEVFAFEPDDDNRQKLIENFGDRKNVHIDARAVSNKPQKRAPFYRSDESSGISSLLAFRQSHEETGCVDVTTLENILEEQNLGGEEIDFLKIDTEGYDFFVLQGVPWEKTSPRLILCEFEDQKTRNLDYGFSDMANYLLDRNYQIIISEWYPVKRYGGQHRWRRFATYPCRLKDPSAWGNIIATDDPDLYHTLLDFCDLSTGE